MHRLSRGGVERDSSITDGPGVDFLVQEIQRSREFCHALEAGRRDPVTGSIMAEIGLDGPGVDAQ